MARQFYGFNESWIQRRYRQGRGSGHGADYQPWHEIRDVPSAGRSHLSLGMTTGRRHYFHSDTKYRPFCLFDWAEGYAIFANIIPLTETGSRGSPGQKKFAIPGTFGHGFGW